ncbi:hypothetical protein Taro_028145 [Colocasia esculenta]|uniref:non-specific serine/threonine protein kinase n=1 Tax=Colocasia esculenta TaxID=4460 RepID=A0A843VWE1_COLES|nr:hypothetical protein [Colocasia esculenta]
MGAAAPAVLGPPRLPRALFAFLLVCLSCCLHAGRSGAQTTLAPQEVAALKKIAEKLKIPTTLWDFTVDPCSWEKRSSPKRFLVSNLTCGDCNATTDICHVVSIELKGQNLTGVLPEELGNLTSLAQMYVRIAKCPRAPGQYLSKILVLVSCDLTRNYINGSIPAAAWTSTPLVNISLLGNMLSGPIPEAIGRITTLQSLVLENNMLQGPLPRSLGNLKNLSRLLLSANNFTGELPETLGLLKNLTDFRIDGNDISGKIPSFLGNWTKLGRLDMQGTSLEGPFPSNLSLLQDLTDLRITDLKKSDGNFPSMEKMVKMKYLILRNCSIFGQIPDYIQKMEKLKTLIDRCSILRNEYSNLKSQLAMVPLAFFSIPESIFPKGISLPYRRIMLFLILSLSRCRDLSFNKLTGAIPSSFENLQNIDNMYLTNNELNGSIPAWIHRSRTNLYIHSLELLLSFAIFYISLRFSLPIHHHHHHDVMKFHSSGIFLTTLLQIPHPHQALVMQETRTLLPVFHQHKVVREFLAFIATCLRKGLPCNGKQKNYQIFINCGGRKVTIDSNEYEEDTYPRGSSTYFLPESGKWASSSTGDFVGNNDLGYIAGNTSILSMLNPELYMSARLNPISLKYYGLCLMRGSYTVRLHFAEIIFTDDQTFLSLGRRVFDVSIQGMKVLKDFNIAEAANGTSKEIVKTFTTLVESGTLEIHFQWVGKGTNAIPDRGYYGSLISAISVTPNFTPKLDNKKLTVSGLVGIVVGACVLVVVILICLWLCLRRKNVKNNEFRGVKLHTGYFSLKQIKAATNNFDHSNKIGEDGFGPVFKYLHMVSQGVLSDGSLVAVKHHSCKSKQRNRVLLYEIGMISALEHPNLVKHFGCCIEDDHLLLIYEYMENNSLARALFDPDNMKLKLDWQTRHKICLGVAKGLAYLHEESILKIVQRDIKATHILLDKDLNAKISNFGLDKLDEEDNTRIITRRAGNKGYMAPEYAMKGYLTDKADVYSFGIVILEIVSGKSNSDYQPAELCDLLDWAYLLQERGSLLELVDPRLGSSYPKEEVQQMLNLALICTNPFPKLRPPMSTVVSMLEGQVPVRVPSMSHVQ